MPERKTIEVLIGQKEPAGEVGKELKGEKAPRREEVSGRWECRTVIECPYCDAFNYAFPSDMNARFLCWSCNKWFRV